MRYGKKHDRCYGDKIARSNRGRTRTSAASKWRKHMNLGYRRSQTQLAAMRGDKKRTRLQAKLSIEDALFDSVLAKSDPSIWLHGTDLTSFKDTVTQRHCGYPFSFGFVVNSYEYVPDAFDWDWEEAWRRDDGDDGDDGDEFRPDYGSDWYEGGSDSDPAPIEAAWRDLWVAGRAYDPEGRDAPDFMDVSWYSSYYDDYDDDRYAYDIKNPLLEREDPARPTAIEAVEERNRERYRAGERYFKQTGRTVLKSLVTETRRYVRAAS